MRNKNLYVLWGIAYIVCVALGFVPEVDGLLKAVLILVALGFFGPPGVLLYRGIRQGKRKQICRIRNISALSLGATLVVMVVNLLCAVNGSESLGDALFDHGIEKYLNAVGIGIFADSLGRLDAAVLGNLDAENIHRILLHQMLGIL